MPVLCRSIWSPRTTNMYEVGHEVDTPTNCHAETRHNEKLRKNF